MQLQDDIWPFCIFLFESLPVPQFQHVSTLLQHPTADVLGGGQIPFHILRGRFRPCCDPQSIELRQLRTVEYRGIPRDT